MWKLLRQTAFLTCWCVLTPCVALGKPPQTVKPDVPAVERCLLPAEKLLEPCMATHVAAWHLKRGLLRHGNTWFGVAAYHSVTPTHNARYQALVRKELRRSGAMP